jgi:hypothetical protein
MEARPTAGLESRFERKLPLLRRYAPTALRSRILGNSKELQEVNRRQSPPNLLPSFYCVTVYEFYHFSSLRASALQNPSSRFPGNPKQMTPKERIPEADPVWQARSLKYFKMMCRLPIPALSAPNFALGNIALALP